MPVIFFEVDHHPMCVQRGQAHFVRLVGSQQDQLNGDDLAKMSTDGKIMNTAFFIALQVVLKLLRLSGVIEVMAHSVPNSK
ncbi:MAG: hypothetical protein NVS3B3_13830 [Aquirhabdus sp.]